MARPIPRSGRQQARGGDNRKPVRKGTPVAGKAYSRVGRNRFRNTKAGNPRQGEVFKIGKGGAHVYRRGGKTVRIGGGKGKAKPRAGKPGRGRAPKPAFDITAPITDPKLINREAEAVTRMRYRPQFRQIDEQAQDERNRAQNVGSYYDDYIAKLTQAASQSQQASSTAQQAAYGQANQQATMDETARKQALEAAKESAAQRGAQVDEKVFEQARQAAAERQSQATAYGGLVGAQGASQAAYMHGQVGVGAGRKVSALSAQQDKASELAKLRRDLLGERGEYKVAQRGSLIDRERRSLLENKAFGLDVAELQQDAKDAAAARKLARQKARRDARRDRRDHRADRDDEAFDRRDKIADNERADRGGGGNGPSSLTPTQRRAYQADFGQALALVGAYMKNGKLKKGVSSGQIVQAIVAKKGYPRPIAQAAVERALRGSISPKTAKKLRKFGVRAKVGKSKPKPKKVKIGPGGIPVPDIKKVRR